MLEEVLEVLEWIQAVGLGSLDDAVDGGAGLGSFRGVAEQPILAADGEVADRAPCKPFVDGKELVDTLNGFFADAAGKVFFRQIWRNGLDEVPPCMCLAEGMCVAGYFLVAGVAVCLQDAVESLEEVFCVTATASGLVLVEADGMRLLVLAAAEDPHVGFRRILAALLFVNLHGRLICMEDILLEESLLQSRGKRHEPVLGGPDDPVGQRCTRERDANLFPFSFLSVERHGRLLGWRNALPCGRRGTGRIRGSSR